MSIGVKGLVMVLKVDGNSETGAHVRGNLYYLAFLMHSIRSRAVTNRFFSKNVYFPS